MQTVNAPQTDSGELDSVESALASQAKFTQEAEPSIDCALAWRSTNAAYTGVFSDVAHLP
jgi:hypothetical protein